MNKVNNNLFFFATVVCLCVASAALAQAPVDSKSSRAINGFDGKGAAATKLMAKYTLNTLMENKGKLYDLGEAKTPKGPVDVKCMINKTSKLACGLYTSKRLKGAPALLKNSKIRSLNRNRTGRLCVLSGLVSGKRVEVHVQFTTPPALKNGIKRDLKEKLAYVAEDFEDELDEGETSSDLEKK